MDPSKPSPSRAALGGEFEGLMRRCSEKAYNFAWRLSGNEADAWDLLQEALKKAYDGFASYDRSRSFDSWLFKIMQNIYLDDVRRESRHWNVSLDAPAPDGTRAWEDLLPAPDIHPLAALASQEESRRIQEFLQGLPAPYRTAVILCDVEGLSYESIATVMNCPVGTVRSRVHQGRLLLKRAFEAAENKNPLEKQLQ